VGNRSEDRPTLDAELARTEPATGPTPASGGSGADGDAAALPPGTAVGRYVIAERLGAGAMGVVYAARDPSLDRRVALKLMAPGREGGSAGGSRLLREAQALARLSHPNVIAVHDVGRFGEQVFIAMELVPGTRLADVLRAGAGDWKKLLPLFLQAGEGLAAAHAAGLVHRDFKPENVLVGTDGRVRVLDFGLARAADAAETAAEDSPLSASGDRALAGGSPLVTPLTELGAVVGTPAYMAPEQFRRTATDPRTDQWAFCVALYVGLFGRHPFGGATYAELAEQVLAGRIAATPASPRVPARLRRIVLRGLSIDPAGRYPSMAALLGDLRGFQRGRLMVWVGLAAAVVLAAAIAGTVALFRTSPAVAPAEPPPVCPRVDGRLAGVWDDAREQAARQAFLATRRPYAESTLAATTQLVDGYAASWVTANQEACEATRVYGTQSEELLDLRSQCLDERLAALRALTDLLVAADAATVLRSVPAAAALPPIDACADARGLRLREPRPAAAEARARLAEVEAGIDRAQALHDTGRFADGLAVAAPIADQAEKLGYRPVEARARLVLGLLQMTNGALDDSRRSLEAAALAAEAGRDDEMVVRALVQLVFLVGDQQERPDEAFAIARRAEAALERMGGDERERGFLLSYIGEIHWISGRYPEAQQFQEQALAVLEQALGKDDIKIASVLLNLGNALDLQGKNRDAQAVFRRALDIRTRLLGARHPAVADIENSLGNSLDAQGDADGARRYFAEALAIWEEALGPDHPRVAVGLDNLARIERYRGHLEEAVKMHRRALDIRTRVFGPDHPQVAISACSLANSLLALDRLDEARPLYEQSLSIDRKALGDDHPSTACALEGLGYLAAVAGKRAAGLASYQRALALREKDLGPDHPDLISTLTGIGRVLLLDRGYARARPVLERALRLCPPTSHGDRADIELVLGRVLTEGGLDPGRGRELVRAAVDDFARAGLAERKGSREARAWLARHGG